VAFATECRTRRYFSTSRHFENRRGESPGDEVERSRRSGAKLLNKVYLRILIGCPGGWNRPLGAREGSDCERETFWTKVMDCSEKKTFPFMFVRESLIKL